MIQNLHIFKNPEEIATHFADQMMNWMKSSSEESFHLAISGGKTPDLLFSVLAEKYKNSSLWQKTHIWWVDERMVLPNHPDSNFGVARKLLLSQISIPEVNIHRIKGENIPENEARSYSAQIQETIRLQESWPVFNLILLGMGDDGHTASIFPDQMHLLNSENFCEVAIHPITKQKRITLTGKIINHAEKICFLVTGAGKANLFSEIKNGTEKAILLPAAYIIPEYGDLYWFVDESAAQLIE
jgi:6-phosphogluconolactonase